MATMKKKIQILGMGCPKCAKLYAAAEASLASADRFELARGVAATTEDEATAGSVRVTNATDIGDAVAQALQGFLGKDYSPPSDKTEKN